jgi:hypothetical protein
MNASQYSGSAASCSSREVGIKKAHHLIENRGSLMSGYGTFVWTGRALQAECDDLEMIGLALLYPALERSVCAPGHHGYPRTSDLILRKALKGR